MDHDYAVHVLKLPLQFSLEQLRTNYKRMALLLHPDRRTLDTASANQMFSVLTDSYKLLKAELDGDHQKQDADWLVMKGDADHHMTNSHRSSKIDPSKFNIAGFNSSFTDNRLGEDNDRGYSSWMQRLSPDAAASHQKRRQEDERTRAQANAQNALMVHEPEALPSPTSIPHSDLGTGRIKDFGRQTDVMGRRMDLGFTDYKVAHMTASCLIDPEIVRARQQFNNIEEYERARSDTSSASITPQERDAMARAEAMAASKEDRRLNALRNRDELVSRHHAKLNMTLE